MTIKVSGVSIQRQVPVFVNRKLIINDNSFQYHFNANPKLNEFGLPFKTTNAGWSEEQEEAFRGDY